MNKIFDRINKCVAEIRKKTDFVPKTAIVLGSGLGDFANEVKVETVIGYHEIEGFPVSTVVGHTGEFIFGYIGDEPVVVMKGRVHFYEGYKIDEVVLPIRVMKMLGAEKLILTNAAGGLNRSFSAGNLMLITGHISSLIPSPLIGKNIDELGTRFPDMTEVYSLNLQEKARAAAKSLGIDLKEGVYLQTSGPQYETPEEVRLYAQWEADAVGMSTACEAITAKHMGMEICGVSCITNMGTGISDVPLTHQEVQETAAKTAKDFKALLMKIILG